MYNQGQKNETSSLTGIKYNYSLQTSGGTFSAKTILETMCNKTVSKHA